MAKLPTKRKIFDIQGEGHSNPDGSSRQAALLECVPGERVHLVREPDNQYDANAIAVRSMGGTIIGYLAREDAATLAPAIDAGRRHTAKLHKLTGGVGYAPSYGAKISIAWDGQPEHPHEDLYAEQIASRRGKKAIIGRDRDASGRLVAADRAGCVGGLALCLVSCATILMLSA